MKKCLLVFLGLLSLLACATAQSIGPSVLNSSGGSASISGNTYEWSVGEMTMVSSYSSANLVVTQGLLQPVLAANAIHDIYLTDNLNVFPVPTNNEVFLQPSFNDGGRLMYELQDAAGKIIFKREAKLITGKEKQSFDMNSYSAGNYILQVVFRQGNEQHSTAYKIQKNH